MPDTASRVTVRVSGRLLVWDVEGIPSASSGSTVLWRSFETAGIQGNVVSMPRLIEERADELRSRYLAWVHDLGEALVDDRTVCQHLQIRSGLSYWWMAAPAQKYSISAVSLVPDAIKLLAFEALLMDGDVQDVCLHSANVKLVECLSAYCRQAGLRFEWRSPLPASACGSRRRAAYTRLPRVLRALLSFCKYCVSRLWGGLHRAGERSATGSISFFDVLVHLDKRGIASGRFVSNYWGPLVDKLSAGGVATNWFHLFFPHPEIPRFAAGERLLQRFRQNVGALQFHSLIDTFPTAMVALRAWRDYLRLRGKLRLLEVATVHRRPAGSNLDLWPLLEDEWAESVAGPNALMECLRLGLFEAALAGLPRQQAGVYLCENQPWEMSLIHAWRKNGHGQLVAVPHATVRFWDLRYFHDPRVYASEGACSMLLPDHFALNGPFAHATFLAGGCPDALIVEVEALRFMHLLQLQRRDTRRRSDALNLLVCGDFLKETNGRIFKWLDHATQNLSKPICVVFKPHPAFPYCPDAGLAARIELRVDERPLMELLPESDLVITSAITSAAVDSYCAGKRVVQVADGGGLNANSLRGLAGVCVATTQEALAAALQAFPDGRSCEVAPYFRLDPQLTEWLRLLRSSPVVDELQFSTEVGGH